MKKKIIIITFSYEVGLFYKSVFEDFFGNCVEIIIHSLERGMVNCFEQGDLYYVGTTSSDIFEYVVSLVPERKRLWWHDLPLKRIVWMKLKNCPKEPRL